MVDVLESIDAAALRRWAYRCVDSLTARCDEIDALHVFPIPDSDTGTNLMFTFRAAVDSALPGHFVWFAETSRHCTLRSLAPAGAAST